MRYHVQGGLEVLAQMLDRYDYTQDADFARNFLLPMADATMPITTSTGNVVRTDGFSWSRPRR